MGVWFGMIEMKNILGILMMENKIGMVYIYGLKIRGKLNYWEIDMLGNGGKEKDVCGYGIFFMQNNWC